MTADVILELEDWAKSNKNEYPVTCGRILELIRENQFLLSKIEEAKTGLTELERTIAASIEKVEL